jgi:predicted negative regulator of RcsB-dependent stress response
MKKLKTGHYLIGAFVLLVGLLIAMNYINNQQENQLKENGVATVAVITDIDVNNYKANEL